MTPVQHVLSTSFQVSFFCVCSYFVDAILCSIWHQFRETNPSENRFKKRVPPCLKQLTMAMARGSLTAPLACALLKQETIVRAQNVVRIRVHGSGFGNLFENCCLSWFRLQKFQKITQKW